MIVIKTRKERCTNDCLHQCRRKNLLSAEDLHLYELTRVIEEERMFFVCSGRNTVVAKTIATCNSIRIDQINFSSTRRETERKESHVALEKRHQFEDR